MRKLQLALTSFLALGLSAGALASTEYPSGPISMIVPFSAGGSTDILARVLAKEIGENLNTPVVVENKPGAEGFIGARALQQAKPNGLTIMMVTTSVYAINQAIFSKVPYDSKKDFTTVGMVASSPNVILVKGDSKYSNLKDVLDRAKAHPDTVNYATGATMHLLNSKWLEVLSGSKMTSIPYKGSAAAYPDLIAGRVDFMVDQPLSSMPFVKQGQLKAIAVTSEKRWSELPDVPTVKEQGYPEFITTSWWAILAPSGTPDTVVRKLNGAILKGLSKEEIREKIRQVGADVSNMNLKESQDYTANEITNWAKIAKDANVKID